MTRMTTTKQWDKLNRLTNIVSTTNAVAVNKSAYAYNLASQRTRNTQADGSYWVYQYDTLGQVTSGRKYWSNGSPVAGQQFDYAFDDIGNRKSEWEGGNAGGFNLRRSDYTANALNQYTQRTVPAAIDVTGAASSAATVTVNNQTVIRQGDYFWKEFPITNAAAPVWTSLTTLGVLNNGANPDIVTSNTGNVFVPQTPEMFTNDADGNLLTDGRWTCTWDAENRLLTQTARTTVGLKERLAYEYDWQGRRIHKQVWTNWSGSTGTLVLEQKYIYDNWNLIAVVNVQPTATVQTYVWGLDMSGSEQGAGGVGGLLIANLGANGTNFAAHDGNGNVAALYDANTGTNTAVYEYAPFGKTIRMTGVASRANPFRFSTKFFDDETDLYYYVFRYYNPIPGRFINRDPIEENGGIESVRYC
jgi:RHS repeat-associated protein